MGRDTIQLEDAVSTISKEYLLEFTSEYGIPENLHHPELPGPEEPIVEFPEGKVGVYTKFFEFANYRIPISQFLFDIFGYYKVHLSQLSVIGAAKGGLSHPWDWFCSSRQIRRHPRIRAYYRSPGAGDSVAADEDEPRPRLQRSISLPPFYNLEWK
ncbi:hypothetical protein Tco_0133304 [Tanacetum coccineum]